MEEPTPDTVVFSRDVWACVFENFTTGELCSLKLAFCNRWILAIIREVIIRRSLRIDTRLKIAWLMDICYNGGIISYVQCRGKGNETKDYYPCGTLWYDRPSGAPRRGHDPNYRCRGVNKCIPIDTVFGEAWEREEMEEVLPFDEKLNICATSDAYIIPKEDEHLRYIFKPFDEFEAQWYACDILDLIYLPRALKLINIIGKNPYHEGSDHINIKLDFHDSWTIEAGVHTICNIMDACYRVKHNKFCSTLEVYIPFALRDLDSKLVAVKNGQITPRNKKLYEGYVENSEMMEYIVETEEMWNVTTIRPIIVDLSMLTLI